MKTFIRSFTLVKVEEFDSAYTQPFMILSEFDMAALTGESGKDELEVAFFDRQEFAVAVLHSLAAALGFKKVMGRLSRKYMIERWVRKDLKRK